MKRKIAIMRIKKSIWTINVIIPIISVILALVPILEIFQGKSDRIYIVMTIGIVLLQGLCIWLSQIFEKQVDEFILGQKKSELLEIIKPYNDSNSIQSARDELRYGLNILISMAIIGDSLWAFFYRDILSYIAIVSLTIIAYMYADYLPHAATYAKIYDSIFIHNDMAPNSTRGLARIYLDEYKQTHFNAKNCWYEEQFNKFDSEPPSNEQDMCIKNILFAKVDSVKCTNIVYSLVIMFFNIVLLIPDILDIVIEDITTLTPNSIMFKTICVFLAIIINILFCAINVTSVMSYQDNCNEVKQLADLILNGTRNERLEYYCNLKKNERDTKDFHVIRARGIFVFCSNYISNRNTLDNIPSAYRMMFIHKYYANIPRFWITILLLTISVFTVLFELRVDYRMILLVFVLGFVLTMMIYFLYLPNLGKIRISYQCRELLKKEKTNTQ